MSTTDTRHVACARCGTLNRVPSARLTDDPVCGSCQQALLDGQPLTLGDADFDTFVERTQLPVVVDFWAPWCGPCRMMAPAFEQAARQMKGRAVFVKVDTDINPRLAARFAIRSIPSLVRLQQGTEVRRTAGALPAAQIAQFAA